MSALCEKRGPARDVLAHIRQQEGRIALAEWLDGIADVAATGEDVIASVLAELRAQQAMLEAEIAALRVMHNHKQRESQHGNQ